MSSKAMRAARHASRNVSNQEWEQQACERQAGSQRCSPSACLNANTPLLLTAALLQPTSAFANLSSQNALHNHAPQP